MPRFPRRLSIPQATALAATLVLTTVPAAVLPGNGAVAAPARASGSTAPVSSYRAATARRDVKIRILSGRADLISGGSALVAISLPKHADAKHVTVTVGHRNVTKQFAFRQDGRYEGLLRGLAVGRHLLKATLANGQGAAISLVDHPKGGPIISGPQLTPWTCQAGAVDKQCNQKPTYTYKYKSSLASSAPFMTYDRSNPPADVAMTTTDQGVKVPFIVRVETGYMDRDQYQISSLFQPGKPWTAVAPQAQYNHKLLILHGVSCGDDRTTGTAPATTGDSAGDYALSEGFITMSTALDNSGHNCNIAVQAESLIMAKEQVVTRYGAIRYTIGTGCSGGSLAQQWIANAYPGVYQGILPTCSFPDAYSTATQFLDYHLLLRYFTASATATEFNPAQEGDILGGPDGVANAKVSDTAQFHVAVPTDPCAGITDAQRYNPATNPGGVRCTIQDAAINVFGPEPKRLWSANERKVGHGFVRIPVDNVGVQYGLKALEAKEITPAQFVDLNAHVGGVNIDTNPTKARISSAGSPALARAYRSGMINEANNLNQTAIIDCRGPNPGVFHDAYRAFAIRARLDREHGTHANQVIWEGPTALLGDADCELNSFKAMDGWLHQVEKDHSGRSVARKLIKDKPASITDRCYDGVGNKLSNSLCPAGVVNVEATPRMVAGDSITTDANKCQLKPLKRSAYQGITFTSAQWAQLKQTFKSGVCNFAKRGVDQQPTIPWQTYQNARGHVVYGGKPLGKPPVSHPFQ